MSSSRPTEPPDPEVPETGAVFTFGRAKYAAENAPNKFWIKKDEVSHHHIYTTLHIYIFFYLFISINSKNFLTKLYI